MDTFFTMNPTLIEEGHQAALCPPFALKSKPYKSKSEKARHEKMVLEILKLRHLLINDANQINSYKYIMKFLGDVNME